ncbi:SMP-30/gluconolactonase/LRE family protein [Amycolatopsis acididurans]|uniref:SMP-30/gluconolactonase/LRE family protein n=1 Tax=Amycolatopsis acididurans TaxID=2724524 RepID=UPI0035E44488
MGAIRNCSWTGRCSPPPNGLCFSPDEDRPYVNDTDQANIRVFDVRLGDGPRRCVGFRAARTAHRKSPDTVFGGIRAEDVGAVLRR